MYKIYPFEQREMEIDRRRKLLAEELRRASAGYQPPQGQVVSGRYVPPAWSQNLSAALDPVAALRAARIHEAQLANDIQNYANADRAAGQAHVAAKPQSVPPRQGPVDPNNPDELAAIEPSRQAMLEWAQSGTHIPSRKEVLAKIIEDLEVNAGKRDEAAAEKVLDREAYGQRPKGPKYEVMTGPDNVVYRVNHETGRAEPFLTPKGEPFKVANAQNYQFITNEDGVVTAVNKKNPKDQITVGDIGRGATPRAVGSSKSASAGAGKTLPAHAINTLGGLENQATTLANLASNFKPEYSGPLDAVKVAVGSYVPGVSPDASNWWRDYRKQIELIERHELFGATLTEGERKAWRAADIDPAMKSSVVKDNLRRRAELAQKIATAAVARFNKSGYATSGLRTGDFSDNSSPPPSSDRTAPVRVSSQAEVDQLPSGTRFIGPDGKTYRKD